MEDVAPPPVEAFPERLRRLCAERGLSVERVAYIAYDPNIEGTSVANLRKILAGKRPLNAALIEGLAAALGVPPEEFPEYRLAKGRELLDESLVGLDEALENLTLFSDDDLAADPLLAEAPALGELPAALRPARSSASRKKRAPARQKKTPAAPRRKRAQ